MAVDKIASTQQQKRILAEKLWLTYFNSYLYENGMLTESQRNRMFLKIENRKGSTCAVNRKEFP